MVSDGQTPGSGGYGYKSYTCAQFATMCTVSGCINSDPKFTALGTWNTIGSFNLRIAIREPGDQGGHGYVGAPAADIQGATRVAPPVPRSLSVRFGGIPVGQTASLSQAGIWGGSTINYRATAAHTASAMNQPDLTLTSANGHLTSDVVTGSTQTWTTDHPHGLSVGQLVYCWGGGGTPLVTVSAVTTYTFTTGNAGVPRIGHLHLWPGLPDLAQLVGICQRVRPADRHCKRHDVHGRFHQLRGVPASPGGRQLDHGGARRDESRFVVGGPRWAGRWGSVVGPGPAHAVCQAGAVMQITRRTHPAVRNIATDPPHGRLNGRTPDHRRIHVHKLLTIFLIVFSCRLVGLAQPAGYTTSALLKVNHNQVPNSDQINFPVFVVGVDSSLKSTSQSGQMQNAAGYDILFTSDAAGQNALPYERALHNTQTGRIAYWVTVPTLSHTVDTPIYVWYGNPAINTDQSSRTAAWDSNYKAVWHMNDNASSPTVADSTANAHTGTNHVNTSARSVPGALANLTALTYTSSQDYTSVASTAGGDFDFTTANFTFEFWLNVNAYVTYASYFGNGVWNHTGYYFQENGGGHGLAFTSDYSSTYGTYSDSVTRGAGVWMHIGVIRNGSSLSFYVNGVLDKSFNNFHSADSSSNVFTIGGSAGSGGMNGSIQEFRVSNTNRSPDWIATAYHNQSAPATFFSQIPWSTTSGYPPACNAGLSQTVRAGTALTLDGSGSFPQDGGSSLSYLWQQIPSAAGGVPMQKLTWSSQKTAKPTVTGLVFGPADFQLTVTQSDGASSTCVVNDGAVATDGNGAVISKSGQSSLDSAVYNLLGPMVQLGKNGWPFYDTAAQADAAVQIANMDVLYGDFWNVAGGGTVSVTPGSYAVVGNGTDLYHHFLPGSYQPDIAAAQCQPYRLVSPQ